MSSYRTNGEMLKALALGMIAVAGLTAADSARADALRETGFNLSSPLDRNDDGSSASQSLGFTANFFGTDRATAFVNNNGNVSFGSALSTFTASPLSQVRTQIIAPFWADVDTRPSNGGTVRWGQGTVDGRRAFVATWDSVGYYSQRTDRLNTFQLVMIERSDRRAGDFDIEFNYRTVRWETGDASGGTGGVGGTSARAGYTNGTGQAGTYAELAGSGVNGAFLDGARTALASNSNVAVPGRYLFEVRNGQVVLVGVQTNEQISSTSQVEAIRNSTDTNVRATVRTVVNVIAARLQALRGGTGRSASFSVSNAQGADGKSSAVDLGGLNGGDANTKRVGVWTDGSLSLMSNSSTNSRFTGNSKTLFLGADFPLLEQFVLGVAMGIDNSILSLEAANAKRRNNGLSGTVYGGYLFNDWLSASAQLTWSRVRNRLEQYSIFSGGEVSGKFDSYRLIAATGLTAYQSYGPFDFSATLGYNRANEDFRSYTASDASEVNPERSRLAQVKFGGEAAYNVIEGGQVFVNATWEWDHVHSSSGDPNGAIFGGGLRYNFADSMSVGVQGSAQAFRANDEQYTVGANFRYNF